MNIDKNDLILPKHFFRINAPTFAYITVYRKMPQPSISGREASHPSRNINDIPIDKEIPQKSMELLMKMTKFIETRSSCQGDSERHLTFFIFRPVNQDKNFVIKLIKKLRDNGLEALADIGTQGHYRICVSDKLWYSSETKNVFKKWWNSLPSKILDSYKEAMK